MTATIQTDQPALAEEGAAPSYDWLALGAALVTVVLWASAFVGIRAVATISTPDPSRWAGCSWRAPHWGCSC
jgi:hypothetical protein